MRLPVSRARYDLLEHNSRELVAQLCADLATADVRAESLAADVAHERKRVADAHENTRWFINETSRVCDALGEQQKRYDALLQTTLALKTQGATVVPVAGGIVEPAAPVVRETDELKALIAELSPTDVRKRAMMLRQLAADRAANMPEDQIRQAIVNGVQTDGVPA